jgi:hypothetical protein
LPTCLRSCRALLLAGARVFCATVSPGWSATLRDLAARLPMVIAKTTQERPSHATHGSTRTMAAVAGISEASVRRIWHGHGLKPHRVETCKLSNDPRFAEKLEDIVGLYLNPPEHALVLSLDEKSQIQALDRTQPGLPMKKAVPIQYDDARLQAAWNHHAVCRSHHARWQCDRDLHEAASPSRIAEVPESHRSPNACRQTAAP